jgi:hypothetical protein
MYVRIARFEGAEGDRSTDVEDIRERMRQGKAQADGPPITRALMLVDRDGGRSASVTFCDTEEDMRKVDEFMNSMSPGVAGGTRTSVEVFEVAVDSDDL